MYCKDNILNKILYSERKIFDEINRRFLQCSPTQFPFSLEVNKNILTTCLVT